jgi:nicotinamidase-related amidase
MLATALLLAALAPLPLDDPAPEVDLAARLKVPGTLLLDARSRAAEAGQPERVSTRRLDWKASETAIIVCDMWDRHWCAGASRRVEILAPRMNTVIDAARQRGVMIIHAPSDTLGFYAETLPRRRMRQAPAVTPPVPIARWCRLDPDREGALPIDDSDGGCDCFPTCKNHQAWSRQHPAITIAQEDGISDSGEEIDRYFRQQGIRHVVLMGVHTNMCVLGRSFGIRQLVALGYDVVLARDLTDTMYNPRSRPYVSHARGTALVIEHIERHWCPTIESADLSRIDPASEGP